jgi:hypothetical protein
VQEAAILVPVTVEPQLVQPVLPTEGVEDGTDFPFVDNNDNASINHNGNQSDAVEQQTKNNEDEAVPSTGHTRRLTKPNQKFFGDQWANYQCGTDPKQKICAGCLNDQFLSSLNWEQSISTLKSHDARAMMAILNQHTDATDNTIEWMHPLALATLLLMPMTIPPGSRQ